MLHMLRRRAARAFNAWLDLKLESDEKRRQSILILERSKYIQKVTQKYQESVKLRLLRGAFMTWTDSPSVIEYTFGPGTLGIGFTKASEGLPVRINRLVPGRQADAMGGLKLGAVLHAVNQEIVGQRGHADIIAMVVDAISGAVAANPAGSAPVRLSFVSQVRKSKLRTAH